MPSGTINVDYNDKTNRFVIHAPFWALGVMRAIPNRKFEKKLDNAWTAPCLRANVEYICNMLPTQTQFTDAAQARIRKAVEPPGDEALPFPADYQFRTEPFDHQMLALNAAYGRKKFALFMDMRTGKTKVTIDLMMALYYAGMLERVIICPLLTLRRNWGREFEIHGRPKDLDIYFLDSGREKDFRKWERSTDHRLKVLMVGIESMSAGKAHLLCLDFLHGPKSMTVIDESDSIKNHQAIRTQRMFELREKSEYRLILTGTPISKGPEDFFAQFEFLDPEIIGIGDFYSFRNRYAIMGGFEDKEIIGYQNVDELTELVKPYVYQVAYKDVFKSPPAVYEERTVPMSAEQAAMYKQIKKDNTIRYHGTENIALIVQNVLEKALRLSEITGGFWGERIDTGKFKLTAEDQVRKPIFKYRHHPVPGVNPKLEAVIETVVSEFKSEQGIIWAIHRAELQLIGERLAPHGKVGMLHGDVSEGDRALLDEDFRAGRVQWIVANPTTGGRGYTFDAATFMINFSSSFSYIHRKQSLERATSSKKTVPVRILDFIVERSVDELVFEALDNKEDVAEFVRGRLARGESEDSLPF